MCDSCGCLLPANAHGDPANITHASYASAGSIAALGYQRLVAAAHTRVGPGTLAKVMKNIEKTEKLIATGRLSPSKMH